MVDTFWLANHHNNEQPHASASKSKKANKSRLSVKPLETPEERMTAMMSSFKVVAEKACVSKTKTNHVDLAVKTLLVEVNGTENIVDGRGWDVIANPPVAKAQTQKRLEPHASGAPTTKANKRAANASNQEKKQSAKEKVAHAQGRN